MKLAWLSVFGAVVAGAALGAPPAAKGHFQTYAYTLSGCPAAYQRQVDPVNVVFWDLGTSTRAFNNIVAHAGWTNTGGSTQYFSDHNVCGAMDGQRASDCTICTRFHIRVRTIADGDPTWGTTSRGDAHHEDVIFSRACHAVDANGPNGSGFDWGRRELRSKLEAGGHGWQSKYWGNTRNFRQCDGDYAGSDGYTVFLRVDHSH